MWRQVGVSTPTNESLPGAQGVRGVRRADVAQLVEHSLGKGEVTSSILVISSRNSGNRDQGTGFSQSFGRDAASGKNKLIPDF
jgi:hypothetical protein